MADELALDDPRSPQSVLGELRHLADQNVPRTSLIGMGYYGTITPPVIVRNVLENPAWYTAYTPYQPEISQGRLEALLNFQTMVAELTGFDLANASLLDEATAAAEAMTMARRLSKSSQSTASSSTTTPIRRRSPCWPPAPSRSASSSSSATSTSSDGGCFGALFSLPTSSGAVIDWRAAIAAVHAAGGLAVVATDLLACVLTAPPGTARCRHRHRLGPALRRADGLRRSARRVHRRRPSRVARALPGRLVGVSTDTEGRPALRLALQTREQHIRREKATSNICTAQVLLANIAGLYAAWHGPQGLRRIAERIHGSPRLAADALRTPASSWSTTPGSTRCRCAATPLRSATALPPRASICVSSTRARSASASTRPPAARRSPPCWRCSASTSSPAMPTPKPPTGFRTGAPTSS